MADSDQATDVKKEVQNAGHSMLNRLTQWIEKEKQHDASLRLNRLILWLEKELHLAGANVESDIESILAKLRATPHTKGPTS